ncbi:lysophospholipase L1-like esterase [Pararhizobium capsulatum DSM 1112]|uniref:Lysophospholipase L1-like esterase n=1 Tax=Pararhizobium capsulatum DSM 1112 TaxID=1121113 RepID=A0ABU0BX90_9HYPH|nr:GDSL-type esterase/lipase family protein [Pararhizobium capsulatum]MDQ0322266.1 lysophospholipase L1-like esterase [Pararhizobium capsulatum DSM 1112]
MWRLFLPLVVATLTCSASYAACRRDAIISKTPIIEQSHQRLSLARRYSTASGTTDLLIIGDSIAEHWGETQSRDFAGLSVINMGIRGERTQELLWRLEILRPSISPSRVILSIGTNNLRELDYDRCEVLGGMVAVAKYIRVLWPNSQLFVLPLLPRGKDFHFRERDRDFINAHLPFALSGMTIVEIDEASLTCGWASQCDNFRPDNIHLVAKGYAMLRQFIKRSGL